MSTKVRKMYVVRLTREQVALIVEGLVELARNWQDPSEISGLINSILGQVSK